MRFFENKGMAGLNHRRSWPHPRIGRLPDGQNPARGRYDLLRVGRPVLLPGTLPDTTRLNPPADFRKPPGDGHHLGPWTFYYALTGTFIQSLCPGQGEHARTFYLS